jgi:hypothetical protein
MPLAVPTPITWSVGEVVTASQLNANVRDAVNFLLNPPLFSGYQASATSAFSSWQVPVKVDTVITDTYGGFNSSYGGYVAQVAGYYDLSAAFCSAITTSAYVGCAVAVNGSRVIGSVTVAAESSTNPAISSNTITQYLNVGDYVQVAGLNSVSAGSYVGYSDSRTRLDARWRHA